MNFFFYFSVISDDDEDEEDDDKIQRQMEEEINQKRTTALYTEAKPEKRIVMKLTIAVMFLILLDLSVLC